MLTHLQRFAVFYIFASVKANKNYKKPLDYSLNICYTIHKDRVLIIMKRFNNRKKITKEKIESYNFKEVALTKMAKRQLLVTLFSILGVTIISLGSAYAVFTSVSKSADYNVIKVGTLNIDFGSDSSNTINLTGQYPMSDEEGLKLTPYTFTITNTGSLAADYEVFIQDDTDMIEQDKCSGNQLNKDYIRYKLDTGSPANLSSIAGSNYKIATGSLEAGKSATYTLYVWIREGVGNDVLNKHYHGKIVVNGVNTHGVNTQGEPVSDVVLENLGDNGSTYYDGTDTFITGEDPNNYIWYSGKLWRAVSVNKKAGTTTGTTKLVTQWNISSVMYNASGNTAFAGSYMEEWLNDTTIDGFLGNLRDYENFIVTDAKWDATLDATSLGSITRPNGTTTVTAPVGLLNMYEYQSSNDGGANGYLNNGLLWWTLTPYSSSNVRHVDNLGYAFNNNPSSAYGVRPSINLKSSVRIVDGDGTIDNPYRLNGDNDAELSGTLLSSRYSGEYITFGSGENNLYRIVSHENGTGTKIVSAEPLKSSGEFITSAFGSNRAFSSTNTIGTFLNGDYLTSYVDSTYSDMIEDSTTWYLGTVGSGASYKLAKYTDTNMSSPTSTTTEAKVGLLRFGELMSGQFDRYDNNTYYWTLTPYSSSLVRGVNSTGLAFNSTPSSAYGVRPSINLKSNVQITSGTGTKSDPFVLTPGS